MAKTLRSRRINQIVFISLGGAICAVILFLIVFSNFSSKKNNNMQIAENGNIEEANVSIGKNINEVENIEEENRIELTKSDKDDEKQVKGELNKELSTETSVIVGGDDATQELYAEVSASSEDKTIEVKSENDTSEEEKEPVFIMPVEGEIVKGYGKEKLIYSDTLKEWTTHLGIDIKAEKTTVVKASSDGCVKSIKNDPRFGLTIVVEHQNGFCSVYSNLLTAEFVVVGENVKAGQTLGTVGNSATFEILDECHLHFEILKDGSSVDPEMYIR